jgi:ABC-2 type transport system ATP-binding protein
VAVITEQPQRANNLLKEKMERWRVSLFGDRLHVIVDEDPQTGMKTVTDQLTTAGIKVLGVREEPFSLEDVFIAVVERLRKEGKSAEE